MTTENICNCHDCNRSYRNMLVHLIQEDPKLSSFKKYLELHFRVCEKECPYSRLYTYLKETYPNGYGVEQLHDVPTKHRACICFYHWYRNAIVDD